MNALRTLDDAAIVVGMVTGLATIAATAYEAYWRRRRDHRNDKRDRRIRDLEARIAVLESARTDGRKGGE